MTEQWPVPPPPGAATPPTAPVVPPAPAAAPPVAAPPAAGAPTSLLTPPPYRGALPPPPPGSTRPGVRRLWRVVGAGFAACTLAFSALQVLSVLSLDSSVVRRSIPADGVTTLVVQADQGTVDVLGTETAEVSVEAEVRRSLVDADVSVRRDGSRVVVDGTCPGFSPGFCSVDVVVRVPSSVAVEVQGRDGDVTVRDITGSVVISSTDGNVVADDIGGPLGVDVTDGNVVASGLAGRAEVSTGNGAVGLSFRTAPDVVSVSTGDGDVDVVVPDGPETYRVDGTSADGAVDATVRTDPAATRSMVLRSGAGSITVRYPA